MVKHHIQIFFPTEYHPTVKKMKTNGSLKESKLIEMKTKKKKESKLNNAKKVDICTTTK